MRFSLTLSAALYVSAFAVSAWQQPAPPSARFDFEVRADFFAGFSGDATRFARAMKRCEDVLAMDPNHAEAMVWHGAGVFAQAGAAFQKGDYKTGGELWAKGLAEMDKAVTLAPDNVGVRVPRGATLLQGSLQVPDPKQAAALVRTAVEDYEHTLQLQLLTFARLSDHAKGELLFGLADGWARLGDKEKAAMYFKRLTADAVSSGRVAYAKAWLDGAPPKERGQCIGCH